MLLRFTLLLIPCAIFAQGTVFPSYINVQGTSVGSTLIGTLPNLAQSNYHSLYLRGERR